MSHPRALEEYVEPIGRDARLDADSRRSREHELAVELPPGVEPRAAAMPKIVVAARQPLREVAQIVLRHEPDRPRETHVHTAIDEEVFEPLGTFERVVHELAVITERVTE